MTPVCLTVLTYGDHPDLVGRCLRSLDGWHRDQDVRLTVIMNEPSDRVRRLVHDLLEPYDRTATIAFPRQVHKYPAMRYFLYGPQAHLADGLFVWFDDDSYVKTDVHGMLADVRTRLKAQDAVLGAVYTYSLLRPFQLEWVRRQWWYTGAPIRERNHPFLPGSWWACPTALLRRLRWPSDEYDHNGGDIMMSIMMQQQGVPLINAHSHVAMNANTSGKDSSQPRRGVSSRLLGDPLAPPPPKVLPGDYHGNPQGVA